MVSLTVLRRLIIFFMVATFVISMIFFVLEAKSNFDQIAFLRKNPFGGHPGAIRANIWAEWRKIGSKARPYLQINGIVLGAGFFILLSIKPKKEKDKTSSKS